MQFNELAEAYRSKTDEELLRLAAKPDQLTDEAFSALLTELAKRNIAIPKVSAPPDETHILPKELLHGHGKTAKEFAGVAEFLGEVLRTYQSRYWSFILLTAPVVVLGYVAAWIARSEVHEIARNRPPDIVSSAFRMMLLKMSAINLASYATSWLVFCISFAAICAAVGTIESNEPFSVRGSFAAVGRRIGSVIRLSGSLFLLLLLVLGVADLLGWGVIWIFREVHFRLGSPGIWVVSVALSSAAFLLLSRFGLAMPAVVLDDYKIRAAIFRSDELTEGKWLVLTGLLSKSLIGGYIAGALPFWLRIWLWSSIQLPIWLVIVGSLAAVTVVEPTLFIGFALMYLRSSAGSPRIA
jgi:hypothetical protein